MVGNIEINNINPFWNGFVSPVGMFDVFINVLPFLFFLLSSIEFRDVLFNAKLLSKLIFQFSGFLISGESIISIKYFAFSRTL